MASQHTGRPYQLRSTLRFILVRLKILAVSGVNGSLKIQEYGRRWGEHSNYLPPQGQNVSLLVELSLAGLRLRERCYQQRMQSQTSTRNFISNIYQYTSKVFGQATKENGKWKIIAKIQVVNRPQPNRP